MGSSGGPRHSPKTPFLTSELPGPKLLVGSSRSPGRRSQSGKSKFSQASTLCALRVHLGRWPGSQSCSLSACWRSQDPERWAQRPPLSVLGSPWSQ